MKDGANINKEWDSKELGKKLLEKLNSGPDPEDPFGFRFKEIKNIQSRDPECGIFPKSSFLFKDPSGRSSEERKQENENLIPHDSPGPETTGRKCPCCKMM